MQRQAESVNRRHPTVSCYAEKLAVLHSGDVEESVLRIEQKTA